ncbi:MAG: hypothetical protein E3J88_04190 [Anaerolineales bacterium]|nr:MAG: hypothetical protein E3J88_04190 [Anaerolineales bacterium]
MNKTLLYLSFIVIFLLAACGGGSNEVDTADVSQNVGSSQNNNVVTETDEEASQRPGFSFGGEDGQAPGITGLLFGTLMLEKTEFAVTAVQAADLVPLWKLAKNLTTSGTAAQEEIQAVVNQIQNLMTGEQLEYLTKIEISPQDMFALFEELGISAFPEGAGEGDGEFPGGGFPGGGPGGEGGGFPGGVPGGGQFTEEQQATAEARREEFGGKGAGFGNNPALFNALIAVLEGKLE